MIKSLHLLGVDCNNQTKDIMNVRTILGGAGYESPVCTPVEVFSEGILCASVTHEGYEDITNYGSGQGWI